jgi:RNA polymerase sigma factor (sigma-70 family)
MTGNSHMTDQELLEKYQQDQNNYWLGQLLQRYSMLLFGVCMKYMKDEEAARDCVQQIYLKVIQELPRYKVEYFKSWIYTIARNHCLMQLRDQPRRASELQEKNLVEESDQVLFPEYMEKERKLNLLAQALQELNEDQKNCITLFFLEKKSYVQIVEITGYSLLQVKSHIQNGKRNLRIKLLQQLQNHA